jgi:hypothetical protein
MKREINPMLQKGLAIQHSEGKMENTWICLLKNVHSLKLIIYEQKNIRTCFRLFFCH